MRRLQIRQRLFLIIALGGLGIGVMTILFVVRLSRQAQMLDQLALQVTQQDQARVMQVSFKKQVQEWKDILLRGHNPADLERYRAAFVEQSNTVRTIGRSLEETLPDTAARHLVRRFLDAHVVVGDQYARALTAFVRGGRTDARVADSMVKGQDRAPTDLIDSLVIHLNRGVSGNVAEQVAGIRREQIVMALTVAVTLLILAVGSSVVARSILRPIAETVVGLERVAAGDLHARVSTQGTDEISRMNRALNVTVESIERTHERLQAAVAASDAANRAKSEFLANMSHEIRTPMNGIIGMTEITLDGELTDEQRTHLSAVKMSADSLLGIINDILDFSKIEAGKLELERIEFRVRDCVGDLLRLITARADAKVLEVICDVDPLVPEFLYGDPGRLRQVLLNLVGNAVKFSERGEVVVGVRLVEQSPDEVRLQFAVRDTGIGIPADRLPFIFKAFTQADSSTTRQYGGTGLGLSICAQLVERMGGTLTVESEVGKGSTFTFDSSFGPGQREAPQWAATARLAGVRVLIVDDNATNREILETTLQNWGMHTTAVASGVEAIDVLEESREPFQLVLVDSQMPDMDGFAFAQRLGTLPAAAACRLIMLTSAGTRGDAARCREVGIEVYLLKPIKRSELFAAIASTLSDTASSERGHALVTRHTVREQHMEIRALLAEDNRVNQLVATRYLEKEGLAVTVVGDGAQAVDAFVSARTTAPFQIIFMDVQMPVMDGLLAAARIRELENGTGRRTCIVALTANAMPQDRARCIDAGMDDYLTKPIVLKTLRDILSRWTSHAPAAVH